jgi:hypothetical protein
MNEFFEAFARSWASALTLAVPPPVAVALLLLVIGLIVTLVMTVRDNRKMREKTRQTLENATGLRFKDCLACGGFVSTQDKVCPNCGSDAN